MNGDVTLSRLRPRGVRPRARQRGSALIAALFLIIVLAALGVFAARVGADQQQIADLQVLQIRATHAANAGLEYWTYRAFLNPALACPAAVAPDVVDLSGTPGLRGFSARVSCIRIDSDGQAVYEVTSIAGKGVFGTPDFVQRQATRRITNINIGTWR